MASSKQILISIAVIIVIVAIVYFAFGKQVNAPDTLSEDTGTLMVDSNSGNYGLFIDNQDNNYFSTTDANVRKIIETHLAGQYQPNATTDTEKYGYSVVYFYNKDIFIAGEKHSPDGAVTAFVSHDLKTGEKIGDCTIFANAGLYKDNDLLLSVTYKDNGVDMQQGACLYERGESNFKFIDLSSKLSESESLFSDPAGQNLKAVIKNIDTLKKTFAVEVYDTATKDVSGNYASKKLLEVSY